MPISRVREGIVGCRLCGIFPDFTSRLRFLAINETIEQWLLYGARVQLQQGTALWYNAVSSNHKLLPALEATIVSDNVQFESRPHTFELPIKSLLHAEHLVLVIDSLRAISTLR
jgi:hypothetical protein